MDLQRVVAEQAQQSAQKNAGWILAYGYDDSQLAENFSGSEKTENPMG